MVPPFSRKQSGIPSTPCGSLPLGFYSVSAALEKKHISARINFFSVLVFVHDSLLSQLLEMLQTSVLKKFDLASQMRIRA